MLDKTGREAVMFSSLRAQVSLAYHWPTPLAGAWRWVSALVCMYLMVAFIGCGVMVWLFYVDAKRVMATEWLEAPRRNRRDTLLLFVICTLMWGSNSLYIIINMPLFIINELHLPEKLAGVMMGTAAGLETDHVDADIFTNVRVRFNARCCRGWRLFYVNADGAFTCHSLVCSC